MDKIFNKLKKDIQSEYNKQHYENVLRMISICADLLYEYNQYYSDLELEQILSSVSKKIMGDTCGSEKLSNKTVFFYDGFGLNRRGLIQIYLKALCASFPVIYVTKKSREGNIPDVLALLKKYNAQVVFFDDGQPLNRQMEEVRELIQRSKAAHLFLYMHPSDVVITGAAQQFEGIARRYLINLTDHAFWLGVSALDYCIEFRDYGAGISHNYRGIAESKLVKLPFYPEINQSQEFLGYPFEFNEEEQKLIFSGGALYKTIGDHNKYYDIVDYILNNYPEAVFWYAGQGDRTWMDAMIRKYPNRVFLTEERKDLFQILKKTFFYLSTYPMVGGLMSQYAACAGRLPLTLKFDSISDGLLMNQEQLNVEFEELDALYAEIDRLFTEDEYWKKRCAMMENAIITESEFQGQLENLIENGKTVYEVSTEAADTKAFRESYLPRFKNADVWMRLADRTCPVLMKYFPKEYLLGMMKKAGIKLGRHLKRR